MNIIVGQSGGPTAVINASLAGIYREAVKNNCKVFGAFNGVNGIFEDRIAQLNLSEPDLKLLEKTPSAALGSCRVKLFDSSEDKFELIAAAFKKYEIDIFLYIGGNDSMETVDMLSRHLAHTGVKFVGVPKTIDNDLELTDHCPGFGSAAKYLCTTMQELILDCNAYNTHSVTIIEIMGRDTGWLTAATSILQVQPDLIYIPEMDFTIDGFIEDVEKIGKKNIVVALSEGINLGNEYRDKTYLDAFGHVQNAGIGRYLEHKTKAALKCKTRTVELNIMQRSCAHLQSDFDVRDAKGVGSFAVNAALNGESGVMVAINRLSDFPYQSEYFTVPVSRVAGKVKQFPKKWINPQNNGILSNAEYYFSPLVGNLPEYFRL